MAILTSFATIVRNCHDSHGALGNSLRTAFLILVWFTATAFADTNLLFFPLFPTNTSTSVNDYAMRIDLGPLGSSQRLHLLPALYSSQRPSDNSAVRPIYVPTADLCLDYQREAEDWNEFISPSDGEIVNTLVYKNEGKKIKLDGTYEVEWKASVFTSIVNLTLRQGKKPEDARNVTVIESKSLPISMTIMGQGADGYVLQVGITNSGSYQWNATKTMIDYKLKESDDYSLMLWIDHPQRRAYSGNFWIKKLEPEQLDAELLKRSSVARRTISQGSAAFSACVNYLKENGGLYNTSLDRAFTPDDDKGATTSDILSGWRVQIKGTGKTTLTYQSEDIRANGNVSITTNNTGINLISSSSQGMGMIALSEIQNKRIGDAGTDGNPTLNVVGLHLGSGEIPGQVVLGGYDNALIDRTQGTSVYGKREGMDGELGVQLVGITYIPNSGSNSRLVRRADGDSVNLAMPYTWLQLSYNSPTISLPESILNSLLPYLGAPVYSQELNGHVYQASPKTDYSLRFTFSNGTRGNFVNITVPASSLLAEETVDDNPLTNPHLETGRKYLLLAPLRASDVAAGKMGYLGRAALKHTYVVNDGHLRKFHISAVNATAAKTGTTNFMTGSYGILDDSPAVTPVIPPPNQWNGVKDKSKLVGPVLGGVIGGLAAIWLIFLFFYMRRRRSQNRLNSAAGDDEKGPNIEKSGDREFGGRRSQGPQGRNQKEIALPPSILKPIIKDRDRSGKLSSAFILSAPSPKSTDAIAETPEIVPVPPVKDEEYVAAIPRPHSVPITSRSISPIEDPTKRKRLSAPLMALDAMGTGPFWNLDDENGNGSGVEFGPRSIPTYHQLLAHHQARRNRASYVESNPSSVKNSNEAENGSTSTTETATFGKVITRGQVAKIRQLSTTPPSALLANSLERRASVGRVMTPGEIFLVTPSRRGSRGSRELLGKSYTPSASPAGSSRASSRAGRSDDGSGGALGHRRGKSAPLERIPPSPTLRARPDSVPTALLIAGGSPDEPGSFLEDASDEVSSSSSVALPKGSRVQEPGEAARPSARRSPGSSVSPVSPVSPLTETGEKGGAADAFRMTMATPPPLESYFR